MSGDAQFIGEITQNTGSSRSSARTGVCKRIKGNAHW